MSGIDPLHDNSEARLSRALRLLAAASASSSQAPAEVGETLARAFRQRHARRRAVRRAAVMAALIVVAVPALLLLKKPWIHTPPKAVTQSARPATAPIAVTPAAPPARALTNKKDVVRQTAAHKTQTTAPQSDDFLPLRRLDPAVQAADMQILRLELSGRALRQVGAPVSAEMDDRRILADFVVGFDGTPYAVRLVQRHTY